MKLRMLSALLTLIVIRPLPSTPAAEESVELIPALKKAATWENYTFTILEQPGPGTGGMLEARYQKDKPLYCKADRIEFFKQANAVVYLDGGRWQRSKTGTTSDPLHILGALAKVNAVRLPHDEVATLVKLVGDAKLEPDKDGGQAVYSAELNADAARSLSRSEYREVTQSGTARFWVGGEGKLGKYMIALKVQGRIGNAEVDGTVVKTVMISRVGATEVNVPDEARKALE